jgi:hypothetical protein
MNRFDFFLSYKTVRIRFHTGIFGVGFGSKVPPIPLTVCTFHVGYELNWAVILLLNDFDCKLKFRFGPTIKCGIL